MAGQWPANLVALGPPMAATSSFGDYNDLFNGVLAVPGTVDVVLFVKIYKS